MQRPDDFLGQSLLAQTAFFPPTLLARRVYAAEVIHVTR